MLKFQEEESTTEKSGLQVREKSKQKLKKLIIGLIGCGTFAQGSHLPHLISNPNCKIKGICTQHQNTANLCKEKYRPDFVTTNYTKILKDPEINTSFIEKLLPLYYDHMIWYKKLLNQSEYIEPLGENHD